MREPIKPRAQAPFSPTGLGRTSHARTGRDGSRSRHHTGVSPTIALGEGEPVEPGDLQRVALADVLEDQAEFRAGGLGAACGLDVDVFLFDAGALQGVELVVGVLVGGRCPRLSNEYVPEPSVLPFAGVDSRRGFSTVLACGFLIAVPSVGGRLSDDARPCGFPDCVDSV